MGEKLGNFLGTFAMVDKGLNGDCLGSFLRIRVGLKVTEPLKHCVTLRLVPDELAKPYEVEYERIHFFCLFCGSLDYVGSGCEFKNSGVIEKKQYWRWKTSIKDVFRSHVSPVEIVHSHHVAFSSQKDISLGSDDTLHKVSEGSLSKKRRLASDYVREVPHYGEFGVSDVLCDVPMMISLGLRQGKEILGA
ncbi:unnamed protein product [Prunus armeniaca]